MTADDTNARRTVIALDHVTLAVGGRDVLVNVSLDIRRGEFIGVLGPNGAGKTTLMRSILGLIAPSAGASACLAARRSAAIPPSATCRRCAPCCRICACAGSTSSPVRFTANDGGCRRCRAPT